MQKKHKIEIFETPKFVQVIEHYLSEHEISALHYYLASNPTAGNPIKEWPGLQAIEWGINPPIHIVYLVSESKQFISLVDVLEHDDDFPDPAGYEGKQTQDLLNHLKKLGIGLSIVDLIDWFKRWF